MAQTHLKMASIVNNESECCLAQPGMKKWQDLQMRECVLCLKIDEGWRKLAAHRKRPSPPLNQKPYARRQTNRSIVRLLWSKQNFAWQWVGQHTHTHTQSTTTLTAALGKKKKSRKDWLTETHNDLDMLYKTQAIMQGILSCIQECLFLKRSHHTFLSLNFLPEFQS